MDRRGDTRQRASWAYTHPKGGGTAGASLLRTVTYYPRLQTWESGMGRKRSESALPRGRSSPVTTARALVLAITRPHTLPLGCRRPPSVAAATAARLPRYPGVAIARRKSPGISVKTPTAGASATGASEDEAVLEGGTAARGPYSASDNSPAATPLSAGTALQMSMSPAEPTPPVAQCPRRS